MKANLANRPSIARIREVLAYDPITGVLTWKITSGRAVAGREAGNMDASIGYHRLRVDGTAILSHHCAWAIMTGEWVDQIDHIRGKEVGNMWDNLRLSTQSENMQNMGKPKHNTSGIKGASFHKVTGLWQAQISVDGKRIYLGVYPTKEAAGIAYAEGAVKYFGEFANRSALYKPK